jgi:hypothetical protein
MGVGELEERRSAVRRIVLSLLATVVALVALVMIPTSAAQAHVERPSYWPNPKADCHVAPCAGGKVPKARSLASALNTKKRGETFVVCKDDSMKRLKRSVKHARKHGYDVRPTDHRKLSRAKASSLLRINEKLFKQCRTHVIQKAVDKAGNNDRVVVMPGLYLERHSRKKPTFDPKCDKYQTQSDGGDPGALSHDYQLYCPNDANLVAVIGRGPDTAKPPVPPLTNRHGIPNVGTCIRCNLQLEGSGVSADDVIVEAGDPEAGNGGPSAVGHKKDVGIFVDRADGFVLRNMTIRHAREHDIYVIETDGYRLDRFKTFFAGGYGVLTFVGDHGLVQNCEAAGNGDSGLYPGSGADSTDNRYLPFYPEWRYSQVFRLCDSHHNTGGFSGTDSHGTLITRNNFYDNALGFTTDVFTAPGHPGFPQHGNTIENNNFYANNFNPYAADSDVDPFIPAPVGTGLWLAGGNANIVRNNHFYDNWRRGTMLFAVPDATVCGPDQTTPVPGCEVTKTSTSYDNHFSGNTMGVSPAGQVKPNGTDFWWDNFPGNTGNCWYGNKAATGTSVTSSPLLLPSCANGTDPSSSIGTGDVLNETELAACLAGFTVAGYPDGDPNTCTWTVTPGSPSGARSTDAAYQAPNADLLASTCAADLSPRLCSAYAGLLPEVGPGLAWSSPALERFLAVSSAPTATSQRPLSQYTCDWWRLADHDNRVALVQRIRHYATQPINGDATNVYGYGSGMSDTRAMELFESRCSTAGVGAFALYKLYGAAAPFAAYSPS